MFQLSTIACKIYRQQLENAIIPNRFQFPRYPKTMYSFRMVHNLYNGKMVLETMTLFVTSSSLLPNCWERERNGKGSQCHVFLSLKPTAQILEIRPYREGRHLQILGNVCKISLKLVNKQSKNQHITNEGANFIICEPVFIWIDKHFGEFLWENSRRRFTVLGGWRPIQGVPVLKVNKMTYIW